MKNLKEYLTIEDSIESIEGCISQPFISQELQKELVKASILLVPIVGFRDYMEPVFPSGTEEFLRYCKANITNGASIDICIDDDTFCELSLCSKYTRLGKIVVKDFALPLFTGLVVAYTASKYFKNNESRPIINIVNIDTSNNKMAIDSVENPPRKYLESAKVSFSVTVVDSIGKGSKTFTYDGPSEKVKEVTEQIQNLWNERR